MSNGSVLLDPLDRRVLVEFDRNARTSLADLSRRLKIPEETLRFRLNRLIERKVILGYFTIIDAGRLGHSYYKIFLKLHNVDEAKVQQLIRFLVSHEAVNWVARMDAVFDVGFTIRISRISDLSIFLDELRHKYHRYLHRLTPAVNIEVDFFGREYLSAGKRQEEKRTSYSAPLKTAKLDETDFKILRALARTPRQPVSDIARSCGVCAQTAHQRIAALEQSGIIRGYRLLLDHNAVNHLNFYVLLYLNHIAPERTRKLVEFCKRNAYVNYFIKALGEWDYEVSVEVETMQQYRAFMMELTREFSDIIRDYVGMPVSEIAKLTLEP